MRDILQSRYLRSYVAHKQLARTSLSRWTGVGKNCRDYMYFASQLERAAAKEI